ncbi:MAG: hypothetical protein V3U24_01420, partial [Candidatus Neomarinimicrobiota bacterium]
MTDIPRYVIITCSLVLPISVVMPQLFDGELSGLTNTINNGSTSYPVTFGVRYIPTLSMQFPTTGDNLLDFEISANLSASYQVISTDNTGDASAYRLWLRYSTRRFESRLGLQKINFGPAKLLRSLMWFDRL